MVFINIYVYIDESGSIHKNSKTNFFGVGGYFVCHENKNKVISAYKKINKNIKISKNIDLSKELKSYDFEDNEKVKIFEKVQAIETFCGCVKIFDKRNMDKKIVETNIFFNYAIKLLFKDCILPILETKSKKINFILSVDNRNIRIGDLKNLETYLKTEFCTHNFNFKVTYYDSSTNYGVQLADLTVNTFYNYYKDKKIIEKVLPALNPSKFRLSLFPGGKTMGKFEKITYNNNENS